MNGISPVEYASAPHWWNYNAKHETLFIIVLFSLSLPSAGGGRGGGVGQEAISGVDLDPVELCSAPLSLFLIN